MSEIIQNKSVYSGIMNRWIFGEFADNKKSSIFKDGYDDPTYMTFKVEFGDWGASVLDRSLVQNGLTEFSLAFNNYDQLPMGLLNCPYPGIIDETYWQTNTGSDYNAFNNIKFYSAFQYLRSRNEDTRAKYLYYFVNGLYEIQHDYPFIFKKISGLNELEKFDAISGQRLKAPAKITLECYEGLDLKIRTLFEFYRKAAWDDVYQRWILPENMREFKMIIYVFERRIFQDAEMFSVDDQLHMKMSFSNINADIPVKAYECMPCEFNIGESMSWGSDYDTGWNDSKEEASKLVVNVKNVKTYFKNHLLNDSLSKIYDNGGKTNDSDANNMQQKIDSIMIYDLVDTIERNNGDISESENTSEYSTIPVTNLTVNGAKAMFLDKRILLENEELNLNIKSYIWGNSRIKTFDNIYENTTSYHDNEIDLVTKARRDFKFSFIEDNESYRGGWTWSLTTPPTYNENKSFWGNLGDNIKNVLTGTRRLILVTGAANIQMISNCLFDSFYIPFKSYEPIVPYNNGFGKNKIANTLLISRNIPNQTEYLTLSGYRTLDEQNFTELDSARQIPDQKFTEQTSRDIPKQNFDKIESEREIPEYDYLQIENERYIPNQYYEKIQQERQLPPQEFTDLNGRISPSQEFNNIGDTRKIPEQDYVEIEKERVIVDQKYRTLDSEREIQKQQFKELVEPRNTDSELMELLLIARSLPGFKDMTLEDVRKLPKQDLVDLKEAEERTMPKFKADKSVLLESLKNIDGTNIKLLELDKDNKTIEEQTLEMLQKNQALSKFKLSETPKSDNEKAEKLKKITAFTKDFVENSNKVKKAYVKSILEMKDTLKGITRNIVQNLPINDTYILKKDEKDNNSINSALLSQNDVDQINHNMNFLAISDIDVEKLSFQTLITLQDELGQAIQRSEAIVGLTSIAKNSVATNPDEKFRKNAKNSIIEEPKKDKMKVIY